MNAIDITQQYFELSNQGALEAIRQLLHPQATYSSDQTGLYYSTDDIMNMMGAFFKQHQKLHWTITSLSPNSPHITEVLFTCEAVDQAGASYQFSGTERLVVVDGLIRHIEVRR